MARVLVIPDSKLNIGKIENGLELAKQYHADTIVILGNYFNEFKAGDSQRDYFDMWDYLTTLLRKDTRVVPLVGERELNYLNYSTKVPGLNKKLAKYIGNKLIANQRFMPVFAADGVLYSHAGVTTTWLRNYKIMLENEIRFRLGKGGGAGLIEGAILKLKDWDPFFDADGAFASCMRQDYTNLMSFAPSSVMQIVGHTEVSEPFNAGRIWFANSQDDGAYLFVNNGEVQVVKYGEERQYE